MKRKEFLNRLLKLSQLHQSLNPSTNIHLFSSKAQPSNDKSGKPQPIITKILPCELQTKHTQYTSIKSRQMVIVKQQLIASKVLIHAKGNKTTCRRITSNRRMKTTPTHPHINPSQLQDFNHLAETSQHSSYQPSEQKKQQFLSANLNFSQTIPHYLDIRELQPKVPQRKVTSKEVPFKRISTKISQLYDRQSPLKKHSLTEPAQKPSLKQECITQRNNDGPCSPKKQPNHKYTSNRSQSFQKYQSHSDNPANRQRMQHSNKIKLSVRKQINKNYTKHFVPLPKITAKSFIIYEVREGSEQSRIITAFNSKNSQEVASLTKIMTCILALEICAQFNIDKQTEEIAIGKLESSVGGTTASLAYGQIYTLDQLLLGLMLPSGNDASTALAVWSGRKLLQRQSNTQGAKFLKMECYNRFISQMNCKAKQLKMQKTNYANSHGLMNPNNKSCAYDVALLCEYAMKNADFRQIVSCRHYKGVVRCTEDADRIQAALYRRQSEQSGESESPPKAPLKTGSSKPSEKRVTVEWENTHKLLHLKPKQYLGIKTGFTVAAGPCLSSYVSICKRNFIIIVLGCARVSLRFKETEVLRKWLVRQECLKQKKAKSSSSDLQEQEEELQQKQAEFLLQNMKVDEERED